MKHSFLTVLLLFGLLLNYPTFSAVNGQVYSVSLSIPASADTVNTMRPSFVWNALGMNERTSFSVKVVKAEAGQTAQVAIQENIPVIMFGSLVSPSMMYPGQQPDLDSAATYVWQVTMFDSGIPVSLSEVWVFYTPFPPIYKGLFYQLNNKNRNTIFKYPNLAFAYTNRYNLQELTLSVKNHRTGETEFSGSIPINAGENNIRTSKLAQFPILPAGEYDVKITTSKSESFSFLYKKP